MSTVRASHEAIAMLKNAAATISAGHTKHPDKTGLDWHDESTLGKENAAPRRNGGSLLDRVLISPHPMPCLAMLPCHPSLDVPVWWGDLKIPLVHLVLKDGRKVGDGCARIQTKTFSSSHRYRQRSFTLRSKAIFDVGA